MHRRAPGLARVYGRTPSMCAVVATRAKGNGRRWVAAVVAATVTFVVGLSVGALASPFFGDEEFRRAFRTSAGFGGVAAVGAALVAFAAALYSVRSTREQAEADREQSERRERKEQWWSRAEWALTQVAHGGSAAVIGLGVLEALGRSEWADQHEGDIIAAATDFALVTEELETDAGSSEDLPHDSDD